MNRRRRRRHRFTFNLYWFPFAGRESAHDVQHNANADVTEYDAHLKINDNNDHNNVNNENETQTFG